jgi:hypothetical protein
MNGTNHVLFAILAIKGDISALWLMMEGHHKMKGKLVTNLGSDVIWTFSCMTVHGTASFSS